jgi:hypothetical protein
MKLREHLWEQLAPILRCQRLCRKCKAALAQPARDKGANHFWRTKVQSGLNQASSRLQISRQDLQVVNVAQVAVRRKCRISRYFGE